MDEIDKIQESLKSDNESPTQLASYLTQLAGWNSYYTEMMKKIQFVKPIRWLDIQKYEIHELNYGPRTERGKPLSDKKTEMIWASTEDGQKETALTYELKRIDILYRSINKRLSAIENDYRMSKSQI